MAKATKKQALGRGLSALLSASNSDINSAKDSNADKIVGNIIEIERSLLISLAFNNNIHTYNKTPITLLNYGSRMSKFDDLENNNIKVGFSFVRHSGNE